MFLMKFHQLIICCLTVCLTKFHQPIICYLTVCLTQSSTKP